MKPAVYPNDILETEFEKRVMRHGEVNWRRHGKQIVFYVPTFVRYHNRYYKPNLAGVGGGTASRTLLHSRCREPNSAAFPSISLTGTRCALQCEHCKGKLLKTMIPGTTPQDLWRILADLKRRGSVGCLISGGCELPGSVELTPFLQTMARAKSELNLKIVVHTGIIDERNSKQLAETGIDSVLIDVIGSEETARQVYHLDIGIDKYEASLAALRDSGLKIVPHVVLGLHYGELRGEYHALNMIARYDPAAVVLIVFTPIKGTSMERLSPLPPIEIANALMATREIMPDVPLLLGCARPTGKHRVETDLLAVRLGVDGIAFPAPSAIQLAQKMGVSYRFSPCCCSLAFEDPTNRHRPS